MEGNMEKITENKILDAFHTLFPYLPILFDENINLSLVENGKFIASAEHNVNLNIKIGEPVPEGGAAYDALQTGKVIVKDVPKEVYGFPFKAYAIPIKDDNNNVTGLILAGKSLEKSNQLSMMSQELSAALQQITSSSQQLLAGVQTTLEANRSILEEANEARREAQETDNVIKFVKTISTNTNILGLNASIEASRAGNAGKGFAVVAQEIRKLSQSTNESIKRIDEVLKKMGASVNRTSDKITELNEFYQGQSAAFEEINRSIEKLNETAQTMEELSKKI